MGFYQVKEDQECKVSVHELAEVRRYLEVSRQFLLSRNYK